MKLENLSWPILIILALGIIGIIILIPMFAMIAWNYTIPFIFEGIPKINYIHAGCLIYLFAVASIPSMITRNRIKITINRLDDY